MLCASCNEIAGHCLFDVPPLVNNLLRPHIDTLMQWLVRAHAKHSNQKTVLVMKHEIITATICNAAEAILTILSVKFDVCMSH